jgi:hypothetical protein
VARKRLIKGANAARVEERIARVPADVPSPEAGQGASIFGVLRTMEEGKGAPRGAAPKRPSERKKVTRQTAVPARKAAVPAATPAKRAPAPAKPAAPPRPKPLAPSDFSAAEREAIVRCCSDYRNHLPTYLLAVQREIRVIDSVIGKCRAPGESSPKP